MMKSRGVGIVESLNTECAIRELVGFCLLILWIIIILESPGFSGFYSHQKKDFQKPCHPS